MDNQILLSATPVYTSLNGYGFLVTLIGVIGIFFFVISCFMSDNNKKGLQVFSIGFSCIIVAVIILGLSTQSSFYNIKYYDGTDKNVIESNEEDKVIKTKYNILNKIKGYPENIYDVLLEVEGETYYKQVKVIYTSDNNKKGLYQNKVQEVTIDNEIIKVDGILYVKN